MQITYYYINMYATNQSPIFLKQCKCYCITSSNIEVRLIEDESFVEDDHYLISAFKVAF